MNSGQHDGYDGHEAPNRLNELFSSKLAKPGKLDLDNVSESRRPLFVKNTNLVLFTFL